MGSKFGISAELTGHLYSSAALQVLHDSIKRSSLKLQIVHQGTNSTLFAIASRFCAKP